LSERGEGTDEVFVLFVGFVSWLLAIVNTIPALTGSGRVYQIELSVSISAAVEKRVFTK
jgi:hypothetical protein